MDKRMSTGLAFAFVAILLLAPLAHGCAVGCAGHAGLVCAGTGDKTVMIVSEGDDENECTVKVVVKDGDEVRDFFISADGHGWLGVHIQEVDDDLREAMDLDEDIEGVLVSDVVEDGPAKKAGMKEKDVILAVAGETVEDVSDLVEKIRSIEPDTEVTIDVLRDGKKKPLNVVIGERSAAKTPFIWRGDQLLELPGLAIGMLGYGGKGRLGVYVDDLSGGLAEYFDVPGGKGVLVEDVVDDGPADKAGIKAGDIILKIGKQSVEDTEELVDAIRDMETDKETPIEILRKGKTQTVSATVGKSPHTKLMEKMKGLKLKSPKYEQSKSIYLEALEDSDLDELKDELKKLRKELAEELEKLKAELKDIQEKS